MNKGWDISSSHPWVPFYPYTMLQNPISWPSHKKCRKSIITQKVLVTQSSIIVHCDQHTQKPISADLQAFVNTFSLCKLMFFQFLSEGVQETAKFHILLILTGKNASKLLEWCIFRVQGMPNPMALVVSLYDKRFMKSHNFRRHIAENGVQNHENEMGQQQQQHTDKST